MKQFFFFFFLFFLFITQAQTAKSYSNEFLNIGVDAKALAMGNSVIASVSDVTAGYWNPAGLSNVKNRELALMHAAYFANIAQYDYLAYAKPLDKHTSVSLSMIRFGVDDIMNTTQLIDEQGNIDYERISYFSAADYALNFSIARYKVLENLNVGATVKFIYRHIGKFASGYGFGIDIGSQYFYKKWQFGLMLRDITTTFNYWNINQNEFNKIAQSISGKNKITPEKVELTLPKFQLGLSRKLYLNDKLDLLTELDFNARFFKMHTLISTNVVSIDPSLGLEFIYYKIAFIRLGINNFRKENFLNKETLQVQPNAGLGFKYKGIAIDYALTNLSSKNYHSHIFSIFIDLEHFINKENN